MSGHRPFSGLRLSIRRLLKQLHHQRQIALDFVFTVHKKLLTVGLAREHIHPKAKGRFDGQVGRIASPLYGLRVPFFNGKDAGIVKVSRKMKLQLHFSVTCRRRIEAIGKNKHEVLERLGAGDHFPVIKFLWRHAFGNAGFPVDVAHLPEGGRIAQGLGNAGQRFRRDLPVFH